MAEVSLNGDGSLGHITLVGDIELHDIVDTIGQIYAKPQPPKYIIWDLSQSSLQNFSNEDVRALALELSKVVHGREDGKTAILTPGGLEFGLSRMFSMIADSEVLPIEISVFRDLHACLAWFGIGSNE